GNSPINTTTTRLTEPIQPSSTIRMILLYPVYSSFNSFDDHRELHSFPTRRSSDLPWHRLCPAHDQRRRPPLQHLPQRRVGVVVPDRKSTRLNSSHMKISYAVFCLKKKT